MGTIAGMIIRFVESTLEREEAKLITAKCQVPPRVFPTRQERLLGTTLSAGEML
jgi:hypothetical protein